ncbi:MAG: (d)CMP kinase, partial [Bacteroidetes bacterium]|nr:(d)CMP kinase [Bacteroidota bacterium]
VIAIDGFSSCGKSTLAKALAKRLNYIYIDSGAMYRAITLYCLRSNIMDGDYVDHNRLREALPGLKITFRFNDTLNRHETYLNDENVEEEIRQIWVSDNVSMISAIGYVRHEMVRLQRKLGKEKGIVMDGRDIGTVVFPGAELKVFMTADPEVRAQRRYKELVGKGETVTIDEVRANISKRDHIDQTRSESPLRKTEDAVVLDNSYITREEQLNWIINKVNEITGN